MGVMLGLLFMLLPRISRKRSASGEAANAPSQQQPGSLVL
jgi:hypothetical protein